MKKYLLLLLMCGTAWSMDCPKGWVHFGSGCVEACSFLRMGLEKKQVDTLNECVESLEARVKKLEKIEEYETKKNNPHEGINPPRLEWNKFGESK